MAADRWKRALRAHVPRELRNWLRSPAKATRWFWLSGRAAAGWNETVRLPDGPSLRCHPIAARAVRTELADPEQAAELRQFRAHCGPEMRLFDIGANFGWFSLVCAGLGGRAVAVEPSAIGARILAAQRRLNRFDAAVDIVQAAAGATPGTLEMLSSGIFADGYFRYDPGRDARELTTVPVVTLDGLCERFGEPTHVKIDVEGFETAVLRGAAALLRRGTTVIFLELHNRLAASSGGPTADALAALETHGYRFTSVFGDAIAVEQALRPDICRVVATPPAGSGSARPQAAHA